MDEAKTCSSCGHEHKEDGTCDCGCNGNVCKDCGHEHKNEDGTCDCGCEEN